MPCGLQIPVPEPLCLILHEVEMILLQEGNSRNATLEMCVMDRTESSSATPKILIVDDDPLVLGAVADRCVRMGFDVVTAINGLQALINVGKHRPDVLV